MCLLYNVIVIFTDVFILQVILYQDTMLAEEPSVGHDFLQKTIHFNSSDLALRHRTSRPAWNPNVSVLELAYKLKEAERSVFGQSGTSLVHSPLNSVLQGHQPHSQADSVSLDAARFTDPSANAAVKLEPSDDTQFNGNASFLPKQNRIGAYGPHVLGSLLYNSSQPQLPVPGLLPLHSDSSSHTTLDRSGNIERTLTGLGGTFLDHLQSAGQNDPLHQLAFREAQSGSEPTQQQRHQCQQCSYSTNNLHHLRRHCASVHTEMKPYQCYVCSLEFTRSEKVREHFVSFHPDIAYDAKLVRKFSMAGVDGAKAQLPPGDTKSRIRALFQDIEGTDMELETDPDRPFGCLRCSYATRDLWHLRRHVFDVHAARKQHNCRVCRYATNRSLRLLAHMRGHGELFCEYCDDFSTLQPEYFTLHDKLCGALAAVNAAGFRCRVCGKDCGDRTYLRSHSVEQHGVELAACNECSFYAYTSDEFLAHVEIHEAVSRTCGLCGLTFGMHVERDQHDILVHLISRPSADGRDLACGICGEVSEPRGSLEPAIAHVRRHVPDKVACKESGCNFKAILSESLEMHARYYHATAVATTSEPCPPMPRIESVYTLSNRSVASPREKAVEKMPFQMSTTSSSLTPTTSLVGTFACPICGPKRTPFKYWRSYEKHMAQHCLDASGVHRS